MRYTHWRSIANGRTRSEKPFTQAVLATSSAAG